MNPLFILPFIILIPIIPLYLVVKILGGEITLLKAIGVKIAGLILAVVGSLVLGSIGSILATVVMFIVYKLAFQLSFLRTLAAWILEIIVMVILVLVAIFLLGVSFAGLVPGVTA